MDQSATQPQPARPQQNEGHRDMMFCHVCHDEWYRDEHGLTCPECGSDFTEIIEENSDPRDHNEHMEEDHDEHMAHLNRPHFLEHEHGDTHDDPAEEDISNMHFRQLVPGHGVTVTGTVLYPPPGFGSGNRGANPALAGPFASFFNTVLGGLQQPPHSQENQGQQGPERQSSPTTGATRFTYTANTRLHPRDPDNPGPHMDPQDELNNVLVGLMASFGDPEAHHHGGPFHGGPFHGDAGNAGNPANGPRPLPPFLQIVSQMISAGAGPIGDAVYSQEGLDRIITQLMEQNTSTNAPGPAPPNDIDSLPRKPVTIEMLGPEGHADCSICMEEVKVGEEVAELPCHHWFHHPCVAAWLGEHNTCPHCRKGITKPSEAENETSGQSTGANATAAAGGPTGDSQTSMHMPGSFNEGGDGNQQRASGTEESQSGGGGGGGGGIGERLRRGLFGPPR